MKKNYVLVTNVSLQSDANLSNSSMQHHQERRVDKGVDKGHVQSDLVRHALLGFLVVPVPVDEGDEEEGAPEYEICSGYHW